MREVTSFVREDQRVVVLSDDEARIIAEVLKQDADWLRDAIQDGLEEVHGIHPEVEIWVLERLRRQLSDQ